MLTFGSLFAGVGGFDLGLERAGMECAWQVEIDKQARSVLRKHWPDVTLYEDVHDVRIPARVDVICGGFPCQDYSVAGLRGGLVGDRGALWWEMHRIIVECRPTWIIGENVPGLLSSNGGRDFLAIIDSLVQLGHGVTWAILDSRYFGVAQRRRRLFIAGHSGGIPRPEVLAISEGLFGHPAPSREAGEDTTRSTAPSLTGSGRGVARVGESRGQDPLVLAHTLRAEGFDASEDGTGRGTPIVLAATLPASGAGTSRTGNERTEAAVLVLASGAANAEIMRDKSPTPTTLHDGPPIAFTSESVHQDGVHHPLRVKGTAAVVPLLEVGKRTNGDGYRDGDGIGRPGDPMYTLQAGAQHGIAYGIPRRLTPKECERLQGWPDDHTRYGITDAGKDVELADGPRYRMCGNGVTATVSEWIGRRIVERGS